jgi:hypothetical protein
MSEYVVLFRLPSGSLYASYDEEIVVRFERRTEEGRLSKAYRPNELPLDSAVATMVVAPPVASTQVRLLKAYPDRELAEFPTEVQKSLLEKAGVKYQIVELTC